MVKLIPRGTPHLRCSRSSPCSSTSCPNLHLRRCRSATFREILDTGRERAGHTDTGGYPLRRRGQSACGPRRRRVPAARGAHSPPQPGRLRGPVAPPGRGLGAAHRDRAGPAPLDGPLRAARVREDHAGADRRRELRRGVRGAERRRRRPARGASGDRARPPPARRRRPTDGPLPRRDPPLQQGPAGRAAAGGGGRARDADRRDDREPGVRDQRRPALPAARLRARTAHPRGGRARARARGRRGTIGPAGRRGCPALPGPAQRRRRADGAERARAGRRDRRRERRAAGLARRASRTRCNGAPSSTTNRATATTTTPPPGSRRPAARTRTPRSTTSP